MSVKYINLVFYQKNVGFIDISTEVVNEKAEVTENGKKKRKITEKDESERNLKHHVLIFGFEFWPDLIF